MTSIAVILMLTYSAKANRANRHRLAAVIVVLLITAISYAIYHFGRYDEYVKSFGYFHYQSIYPLLQLLFLTMIRGKLATCLMALYCIELTFNTAAFWFEGQNLYTFTVYQTTIWVVFAAQMALMMSRKLTNGVHRALCRSNLARSFDPCKYHASASAGGLSVDRCEASK